MTASVLDVAIDAPVARLVLNRPAKLNALNEDVRRALAEDKGEFGATRIRRWFDREWTNT